MVIDFIYSSHLYKRIRKYAKKNHIDIMYEKFKYYIREIQETAEEKYSFLLPFTQTKNLLEYLMGYDEKSITEKVKTKKNERKKIKNEKRNSKSNKR